MESLAYIHMSLEYGESLQTESKSEHLAYQYQLKNPPIKLYLFPNWSLSKLFRGLFPRQSEKLVNH
ncbi:hypothetical protein ACE1B6_29850 [Aerosakkonemataceae cyanobacterium BLCC-F154]|uniref:Uncharacterized protein n=1 Tax=Floridaenema fluviatile BLCC-F154 TaxID=3153640 RepID=A0ABV4YN43_9CYAN